MQQCTVIAVSSHGHECFIFNIQCNVMVSVAVVVFVVLAKIHYLFDHSERRGESVLCLPPQLSEFQDHSTCCCFSAEKNTSVRGRKRGESVKDMWVCGWCE